MNPGESTYFGAHMRYSLVTPATVGQTLDTIARADAISLDTETMGLKWWCDDIVGASVGTVDHAWYFPFRHQPGGNLDLTVLDLLRDACAQPKHLAMWNGNFDWHVLERCGWTMRPWLDGQIAAYTIDETRISFKLEHVAGYELGIGKDVAEGEEKALKAALKAIKAPAGKAAKAHMYRLRPDQVAPYACRDVRSTFDLMSKFGRQLSGTRLGKVFEELMEYQMVLHRAESRGLHVDPPALAEETELARQRVAEMKPEIERRMRESKCPPISKRTGKPYPSWPLATSPDQLKYWLGSADTTKATLKDLAANGSDDAKLVLRFRQWHKAITTYYLPIAECLDGSKLHPSLRLTGSAVRLSCGRPNMQAVPKDAEKYGVKRVFVAPPGKLFCEVDYKQAEIYMAAHFSRDPELLKICREGLDIHQLVSERLGVPRQIAKALNFAIPYGVGAEKFARMCGISVPEARAYIQGHYETFPLWRKRYNDIQVFAENTGKVVLWSGRERRHPAYPKWYQKDVRRHSALNNETQGAVSELIRVSMARLEKAVPEFEMFIQVHDSVLGFVPADPDTHQGIAQRIRAEMVNFPWLRVPIDIDVSIGESWATVKKIEMGPRPSVPMAAA